MRNKTWIYYLILALIAILFLMPMLWLVLSSFNVHARQALKWPDQWTFNNYLTVYKMEEIYEDLELDFIFP